MRNHLRSDTYVTSRLCVTEPVRRYRLQCRTTCHASARRVLQHDSEARPQGVIMSRITLYLGIVCLLATVPAGAQIPDPVRTNAGPIAGTQASAPGVRVF